MNIGFAIQTIRKSKNISQLELSEKCGISQAALSQIENGIKKPGTKTLDKICSVLNISQSLLYVLSINQEDVPESRKDLYNELFPEIKKSILALVNG